MNLSTFQAHLASKTSLQRSSRHYPHIEEEQLIKWAAGLSGQSEKEQIDQLETVLAELSEANIEDDQCLKLLDIISSATERLIATLHAHYIYETGSLSDDQLSVMEQVKSLYYFKALVYEAIIRRQLLAMKYEQKNEKNARPWKRLVTAAQTSVSTLSTAIYQSLLVYQKLLYENSMAYKKPPLYIWSAFNKLYHLACQHNMAQINFAAHVINKHANTIHQLYCEVCLHSLLNVSAMRRSSILMVQRLLPTWALQVSATLEPQTQTRIFVNLKDHHAPEYLTALSTINPYDDEHDCLFLELAPLVSYLEERKKELSLIEKVVSEYRLVSQALTVMTHRYTARQIKIPSKYNPKKEANIITGFNDIHYHAANKRNLKSVIESQLLPADYKPQLDTLPNESASKSELTIDTYDDTDVTLRFRTLNLPIDSAIIKDSISNNLVDGNIATTEDSTQAFMASVLPRLRIMNLLLLKENKTSGKEELTLAMVHWLKIEDKHLQIEAQVLGHEPTPCGLRLDNRDNTDTRSRHFIPALLLTGDTLLDTTFSMLVPSYHFEIDDRVIIRLNEKQQSLRLQRRLLMTEEFIQYEVVRL